MLGVEDRYPAPERFAGSFDRLHEVVSLQTGTDDFGPGDYRLGLSVLLESMDYDPRFTSRGRDIAWGSLVSTLASRALAVREMRRVPDLDAVPLRRPVIITGLHRTGTTALHKLLSVDRRFQGVESWLAAAPMPRPPRDTWARNPLFREALARLSARFADVPGLRAAHDMAAEEVDECGGVLFHGFTSLVWTVAWSAASYDAWWQAQSEAPHYAYLRRVLQLIGRDEPQRRWLLKHPPHIANLDLVFATFPDALVIQTHRDPGLAIPSLCSLVMKNYPLMEEGREAQRARLMGPRLTGWAAQALAKAEPVRRAHADQVLDVRHADFHRDPMAVLRRIYRFVGLALEPDVEQALAARIARKPGHGEHRYGEADYGIGADEIRERFGDYLDRFDLAPRKAAA